MPTLGEAALPQKIWKLNRSGVLLEQREAKLKVQEL